MQVLDFAIQAVPVCFVVFMALDFTARLLPRKPRTVAAVEPAFVPNPNGFSEATAEEAAIVEAGAAMVAQYWAARPTSNVVPFMRPAAKAEWATMSPEQLRKACQARGIKWRSVHGANKHLKKAEMVALLSA